MAKRKPKTYVEYDSNNSGGSWWLKDKDWKALEKAGWIVEWVKDRDDKIFGPSPDGRWLGALATKAIKPNCKDMQKAVSEWENITGQCSTDPGCPCCGNPHNFTLYVNGEYKESGPNVRYSASWS